MSVRGRLIATHLAMIAALAVPGVFAASRLGHLRQLAVEGRSGQAVAVSSLGRIQALMAELDRLERSFVVTNDATLGQEALATVDSIGDSYERLRGTPYGDLAANLGPLIRDLQVGASRVGDRMAMSEADSATAGLGRVLATLDGAGLQIGLLADSIDSLSGRDLETAEEISRSARIQTLVGIVLAVLLALTLATVMTHLLTTPLRKLGRAMVRVADGTFETPDDLPYGRPDEIGELASSFGSMTRRLAELDKTKSEFFGLVSHELKTPLNIIGAYAELIEDEIRGDGVNHGRDLLEDVREQVRGMTKLVSRLMDLSRLEAGSYRLEPETVGTEHLVADLTRMFAPVAEGRGIDFRVRVADGAPDHVVLDVDIMRDEVLGNLILNALRFAGTDGWVELAVAGGPEGVSFTVTDSGPGVPEEHRDLIFKKHYTTDRTRAVGSGLGLAIAKEMVELHGGLITLEATDSSRGACFRVSLPHATAGADLEVPNRLIFGGASELVTAARA